MEIGAAPAPASPASPAAPAAQRFGAEREVDLLRYFLILHKRRREILGATCGAALLTFVTCLFLPKRYESTASIITPQEVRGGLVSALAMSGAGVAESLGGASLPSLTPNRDLFLSLLRSATLCEQVVQELRLQERYQLAQLGDAVQELKARSRIVVAREGVISVTVEDRDPKLAADIANAYVAGLDALLARYSKAEATRKRSFMSERLGQTLNELQEAEEAERRFKEQHKVVAIDEQAKGSAEAARFLRMEIASLEARLGSWRSSVSESNPEFKMLQSLLDEKMRQLAKLQYGKGLILPSEKEGNEGKAEAEREEIYVPFSELPEVELELGRLSRDVLLKHKVYTMLVQEHERARISEASNAPSVQALDKAAPAIRKSSPRVLLNSAVAGALALACASLLAFAVEYCQHLRRQLQRGIPAAGAVSETTSAEPAGTRPGAEPVAAEERTPLPRDSAPARASGQEKLAGGEREETRRGESRAAAVSSKSQRWRA